MPNLEEVYARIGQAKRERREIQKMVRDELAQNEAYIEIKEEMKRLREEKKSIERDVMEAAGDAQKLEDLKSEIQTDQEMLSDIALNMYVSNETVEIVDDNDTRWVPYFSVKFVKD